jgi:ACS family sodium-dependent inorganic phosphate cotransporter
LSLQQEGARGRRSAASRAPPLQLPVEGVGGWSQRWSWSFVGLCALAIGICYADRANIADAIIPMSEEMGWSRGVQGAILSSFFLGYGSTQILGGSLADSLGGRRVLAGAVLLWSLATLCTPAFAHEGVGALICGRVLMGVGEGPAFPAIHSMISRVVLPQHQSTAVSLVTAASYVGSVCAFAARQHTCSKVRSAVPCAQKIV